MKVISLFLLIVSKLTFALEPHPLKVQLVSECAAINPGTPCGVGVFFVQKPGWHVYWKNPGDSGTAPQIKWQLPDNGAFVAGPLHWPTPKKISVGGLVNYGYENPVLLFSDFSSPNMMAANPVVFQAHVEWLVCRETCIPGKADLKLSLPVSEKVRWSTEQKLFEVTRRLFPPRRETLLVKATDGKDTATLTLNDSDPIPTPLYFFPWDEGFNYQTDPRWNPSTQELLLTKDVQQPHNFTQIRGILYSPSGWKNQTSKAVWIEANTETQPLGDINMLQMLLFAFIGGLILNLMPCVFPILSIKILGFIEQAGKNPKKVRIHGWYFTFGVLVSFLFLSLLLMFLRSAGQHLGWGFQLQSPYFVLSLTIFLFILSLNFLGVFDLGSRFMSLGSNLAGKEGHMGSFFSGVLATVVATPCTAPFMGSAVGFALTQGGYSSVLIFMGVGFGMALPYLVLSHFPGLLKYLPRPGRWMETLRQFMAFPLLATVIWLAWVFANQTGTDGLLRLLMGLLVIALAFWIPTKSSKAHIKTQLVLMVSLPIFIAGTFLAAMGAMNRAPLATETSALGWIPYSATKLKELNAKGTPVFIDFTASWCVSCQVNEKLVFSSDEVLKKVKEKGLVLMKADWTNGDPEISAILAKYNHEGVPFYLIYGKKSQAAPQILPEVLTPGLFLDALNKI